MLHPPPDTAFREEMAEQLEAAENSLLALERCGLDHGRDAGRFCAGHVQELFRAFHTIKGLASMVGCKDVATLTHALESVLEPVRRETAAMTPELLELVLAARDLLAVTLQEAPTPELAEDMHDMARALEQVAPVPQFQPSPGTPQILAMPAMPAMPRWRWQVCFAPTDPDLLARVDVLELLQSLQDAGAQHLTPRPQGMDRLEWVNPAAPLLAWECEFDGPLDENGVRDLFIFVEDAATVTVRPLEAGSQVQDATPPDLPHAPIAPDEGQPPAGSQPFHKASTRPATGSGLRVDAHRLEAMVGLVGELVIAQSRLATISAGLGHAGLQRVTEELEHLAASLRDQAMAMRMAPLGGAFGRFRRMVRDTCQELGKDAVLVAHGGETALDKAMLEQLAEPLLHLLRNAVAHGLEAPAERRAAGKPSRGVITLTATQAAGTVTIALADDGRGLDREAIATRVQALGLARDPQALPDEALFDFLFHPGFMAASGASEAVSDDRGLETVRRVMDALRGQATLNSRPGHGVTVQLRLPLTMAIIEGLQVRVGEERFIIPLAVVEECVELCRQGHGREQLLSLRGEIVPCVPLRGVFGVEGQAPGIEHVVVTLAGGQRTGLVVDEVLGQQQAVVKPLGVLFRHCAEFSGAAVQGDGGMALILDVPQVVQAGQHLWAGTAPSPS